MRLVLLAIVVPIALMPLLREAWMQRNKHAAISRAIGEVLPEEFPWSDADRAVAAVLLAGRPEALRDAARRIAPAFEEPGARPVLGRAQGIQPFRKTMKDLTAEVRGAFARGRAEEALALIDSADRLARIYGRGCVGTPLVSLKMAASGAQAELDRAVDAALAARTVPASALPRLEAIYADALRRETGLEAAVRSELDVIEKCVTEFDRQRGALRYLDADALEDGVAQVKMVRAAWAAGKKVPSVIDFARPHLVVEHMLSNLDEARYSHALRVDARRKLVKAIAAQRAGKA